MVHVRDEGVFDAPLDKIWKYVQDGEAHEHRAIRSQRLKEQKGNRFTFEREMLNPDGKTTHWETWHTTMNPPKGLESEVENGPMKGSRFSNNYTPLGNKTKVEVAGDFHIQGLDDEATRKSVLEFFAMVFDEDNANLKNYQ